MGDQKWTHNKTGHSRGKDEEMLDSIVELSWDGLITHSPGSVDRRERTLQRNQLPRDIHGVDSNAMTCCLTFFCFC